MLALRDFPVPVQSLAGYNLSMRKTDWIHAVLESLSRLDEYGAPSVEFLRIHRTPIGFLKQNAATGAIWTPNGGIYLNAKHYPFETTRPDDPGVLSLMVHEIQHLRQGPLTALSVYGELEAWQLGFRVYQRLTGQPHHPAIEKMMSLPLGWDRDVLKQARAFMLEYAGKGYRADLLPLYPLGKEIRYWLKV
jgi:hypothetical protein